MDKKRIEIIITLILVVIFVLVTARSITKIRRRRTPRPAPAAAVTVPAVTQPPAAASRSVQISSATKEILAWIRCPFCGMDYSGKGAGGRAEVKLEGIFWDDDKHEALINGRVVTEGDTFDGYSVVKIKEHSVVLFDGSDNFEVGLEW